MGPTHSLYRRLIVADGPMGENQQSSFSGGHPYLSEGDGNFAIEIYEMTPVPFED